MNTLSTDLTIRQWLYHHGITVREGILTYRDDQTVITCQEDRVTISRSSHGAICYHRYGTESYVINDRASSQEEFERHFGPVVKGGLTYRHLTFTEHGITYRHGKYQYHLTRDNRALIHNDQLTLTVHHPIANDRTQLGWEIRYPFVITGDVIVTGALTVEVMGLTVNTGWDLRTIRYHHESGLQLEREEQTLPLGFPSALHRIMGNLDHLIEWVTDLMRIPGFS